MHARMATFEGGNADQVREMLNEIRQRSEQGPPEGVPAVGLLLLHRADGSKVVTISLFETEADLEQGNATLNSMDPPTPGGLGERRSVELLEVGAKLDAPGS